MFAKPLSNLIRDVRDIAADIKTGTLFADNFGYVLAEMRQNPARTLNFPESALTADAAEHPNVCSDQGGG